MQRAGWQQRKPLAFRFPGLLAIQSDLPVSKGHHQITSDPDPHQTDVSIWMSSIPGKRTMLQPAFTPLPPGLTQSGLGRFPDQPPPLADWSGPCSVLWQYQSPDFKPRSQPGMETLPQATAGLLCWSTHSLGTRANHEMCPGKYAK